MNHSRGVVGQKRARIASGGALPMCGAARSCCACRGAVKCGRGIKQAPGQDTPSRSFYSQNPYCYHNDPSTNEIKLRLCFGGATYGMVSICVDSVTQNECACPTATTTTTPQPTTSSTALPTTTTSTPQPSVPHLPPCISGTITASPQDHLFTHNTPCACAAGFTGPDGGPCVACAAGFYKATIGSAACTDCSTSISCQCGAGTAGITPTPPLPNATRDAVRPNWCTTANGVFIDRLAEGASLVPYAEDSMLYEICVPSAVRNHIDFPSAACDILVILSYSDKNPGIYYVNVPCSTITVAPGHLRLILDNSLTYTPANAATVSQPFPGIRRNLYSMRVHINYVKSLRTPTGCVGVCSCIGGTCIQLCPSTSVATDSCFSQNRLTPFAYPMLLAGPVPSIKFQRAASGTHVIVNYDRIPSGDRGFINPPPTSLYPINGYVVELDTTVKFDYTTRITKECLPATEKAFDCDYDNRVMYVYGLDPTKTYFMRMAGRTILGHGKYAGPFLLPPAKTEVPFASSSMCEQCVVGTYKTSSTQFSNQVCNACPGNTTTSVPGSLSLSSCFCMPGFVGQAGGACQFSACPAGMTNSGPIACSSCAAGTFKETEGSAACTACPAGLTSLVGSASAAACCCDAGFEANALSTCAACPAGKYKATVSNDKCIDCVAGKYSATTGARDAGSCLHCGAGKYLLTTGASAESACIACDAGKYSDLAGRTTASDCLSCPDGATSPPAASSMQNCTCSLAGYRVAVHSETIEGYGTYFGPENGLCICLPGFARIGSSWSCQLCIEGFYCTGGGAVSSVCPPTTSSPAGSDALDDCVSVGCPAGQTGADAQSCSLCAEGTFKPADGSAACTACPDSSSSPAGSTAITNCLCNMGYTGLNGGPCTACGPDTYKPIPGSGACHNCPAYSQPATASAATSCLCYAGTYRSNGIVTCAPCPVGTFKEAVGNSSASGVGCALAHGCCACPQSTTTLGEGATHMSACKCLPGYGGKNCPPCAVGFYKAATSDAACEACPPGATTVFERSVAKKKTNNDGGKGNCARDVRCTFGKVHPAPPGIRP
jgi:hypothetical protein